MGDEDAVVMNEVEQLKSDLRWTESNLRTLREGIRLIASQMMTKNQENQQGGVYHHPSPRKWTEDTAVETVLSEDGSSCVSYAVGSNQSSWALDESEHSYEPTSIRSCSYFDQSTSLYDILKTDKLASGPAADLLALQNAAEMLQEHVRLASTEATVTVDDTIRAQAAARSWQKQAFVAQEELKHVTAEAEYLRAQNKKLTAERKVLVKEVRKIRKELAEKDQENMWTQLESYVTSALNVHEYQLKSSQQQLSLNSSHSEDGGDERNTCECCSERSSTPRPNNKSNNTAKPDTGLPCGSGFDLSSTADHSSSPPPVPSSNNHNNKEDVPRISIQKPVASARALTPRLSTFAGGMVMRLGLRNPKQQGKNKKAGASPTVAKEEEQEKNTLTAAVDDSTDTSTTDNTSEADRKNSEEQRQADDVTMTEGHQDSDDATPSSPPVVVETRTPPLTPGSSDDEGNEPDDTGSTSPTSVRGNLVSIGTKDSPTVSTKLESPSNICRVSFSRRSRTGNTTCHLWGKRNDL